jgi:hypothetical protein
MEDTGVVLRSGYERNDWLFYPGILLSIHDFH